MISLPKSKLLVFGLQFISVPFFFFNGDVVFQSVSCVWLFATPWTAAHQASLSFIISQSFLKLMSIDMYSLVQATLLSLPIPGISCGLFFTEIEIKGLIRTTSVGNNFKNMYMLCWVLVAARGIFGCSMWDLVPWPGMEPGSPALGAWGLSCWMTREVPHL